MVLVKHQNFLLHFPPTGVCCLYCVLGETEAVLYWPGGSQVRLISGQWPVGTVGVIVLWAQAQVDLKVSLNYVLHYLILGTNLFQNLTKQDF